MSMSATLSPALRPVAQRIANAQSWLVETLAHVGELPRDQALKAAAYYVKHRLVKLDSAAGRYQFVHGAFVERDTIRRAVALQA